MIENKGLTGIQPYAIVIASGTIRCPESSVGLEVIISLTDQQLGRKDKQKQGQEQPGNC